MATPPPILFIVADQLRDDALGAFGARHDVTPKLNLLAERSATFHAHYTTCPLCVPARTTLATGRVPHRHGAIINGWRPRERAMGQLLPGVPLLPQRLADAGYRVLHAGVQHVRSEPDYFQQQPGVHVIDAQSPSAYYRSLFTQQRLFAGDPHFGREPVIDYESGRPILTHGLGPRCDAFPLRESYFYDVMLTDQMIAALDEPGDDRPVALFAHYWLPHPPLRVPPRWAELVPPDQVKLPPTTGRFHKGMPVMQLANLCGQLGAHVSMEQWRRAWSYYLGMVALLDQCVGRLLAAWDHRGWLDPALVVFTSDHGEMLGCHGLYQKHCLYEESARVPLIVKTPGQTARRIVRSLTSHTDLPATLLEAGQAGAMPSSDGRSLLPLATGASTTPLREHVFAAYDGNAGRSFAQRMVRSDTHKLIANAGDTAELYDLVDDPRETRNRIDDDPQTAARLRKILEKWCDSVGATL